MDNWMELESSTPRESLSRRTVLRSIAGGAALALAGSGSFAHGAFVEPATAQTAGPVSLSDAVAALAPQPAWENFSQITQIPRPSHHEEQISEFLAQFGRNLGLETFVDDLGDVILRRPASPGMEDRIGMVLQAHMDMVPQKRPDKEHVFETDPIDASVQEGWVHADGTTLGADDGIGLALIMALFQANDIEHGPLEALFTVNEEDGMTGANALPADVLTGGMFLNIDSEEEGVFTIGSAGGVNIDATATYAEEDTPSGFAGLLLEVVGLQGGHSGIDIDKGRGNAIKILARLLNAVEAGVDARVSTLSGGDAYNAIPREARATLAVAESNVATLTAYVAAFEATVRREFAATEPALRIVTEAIEPPGRIVEAEAQRRMIDGLNGVPNGVMGMSASVPGLVETSTNIGKLQAQDGRFSAGILTRSAVDSERDAVREMVESVFSNAGIETKFHSEYAGWQPDPASPIVELAMATYRDLFGKDAELQAVHAGLETSVVGERYPGMSMISVGPTMQNVHSPDERLEIASVGKVYELLVAILERAPISDSPGR